MDGDSPKSEDEKLVVEETSSITKRYYVSML